MLLLDQHVSKRDVTSNHWVHRRQYLSRFCGIDFKPECTVKIYGKFPYTVTVLYRISFYGNVP